VDLLADKIFAWQIDFSRDLRPGDGYRILYERQVRPDGTARSWRVIGALFDLGEKQHSAFWYRLPDGTEDYYDRDGESLRRAFLRAPLEFRRISSAFSTGRFHPILKKSRPHHGIDYAAASGTPIRAVGDGVVARAGWGGGYGNVVEIRHRSAYSSRYAHMRAFAPGIRPGVRVRQGDLIGYVGSTGLSTGPHLHYEFHENGRPINPSSIKYLTGDPVPGGSRSRYRSAVSVQLAKMERAASSVRLAGGKASPEERKAGE
jgi:murein DD-endopeptidase MepM/ murein hydrolase activator NlpD